MQDIKERNYSISEVSLPPWMIDLIRKEDEDSLRDQEENVLRLPLYILPTPEDKDQQKQEIIDYVIESGMEMNSYA